MLFAYGVKDFVDVPRRRYSFDCVCFDIVMDELCIGISETDY